MFERKPEMNMIAVLEIILIIVLLLQKERPLVVALMRAPCPRTGTYPSR